MNPATPAAATVHNPKVAVFFLQESGEMTDLGDSKMSSEQELHFPNRLVIRLIEENTGHPVPGIATTLKVYAKRKNDYAFGPSLSDSSGTIVVERNWVERSINETRAFWLMDYASAIDDCYPYVDLKIISADDIPGKIAAMELYDIVSGKLGIAPSIPELRNASNYQYEPQTVRVRLNTLTEASREVVIKLRQRRA